MSKQDTAMRPKMVIEAALMIKSLVVELEYFMVFIKGSNRVNKGLKKKRHSNPPETQ